MYQLYYMENGRKRYYFGQFNEKQATRIIKNDRERRNKFTFKEPVL